MLQSHSSARCVASTSYASAPVVRRVQRAARGSQTTFTGKALIGAADNGPSLRARNIQCQAQWLENKASVEVPVALEPCWTMWDDRERIPQWMPWIKSVKVQDTDNRLSKWTLSTNQFGRDWEFSWLARNLAPVKGKMIHWVSERGSASLPGVEIANRGQIKFAKLSPSSCKITLIISYEVPDVLVPFANALTPLVEGIIQKDMDRFKELALTETGSQSGAGTA